MRKLYILLLLVFYVNPAFSQTDVRVSAYVQPEGKIYAGQQFTLYLQVQTETSFASSPAFPEVVIANATAIRPEQLGTSFSERIGRKTYVSIRQRYLLSAQKSGVLEIPSYSFSFSVRDTQTNDDIPVTVTSEAIGVEIEMPPGLDSIYNVAVTPTLKLTERYNSSLAELKVGDAFLRSVSLESDDMMSFLLPEVSFETEEGISIYSASPSFEDNSVRGRSTGKRTDSASYLLQEEGEFLLPEIRVQWFDIKSNSLKTLSLDERKIVVKVNPEILDVIVTSNENESKFEEVLKRMLELVNWVIAHIQIIVLVIIFLFSLRYVWEKYANKVLVQVGGFFQSVFTSRLVLTLKLLLACFFSGRRSLVIQLGIWVQKEGAEDFKQSKFWMNMNRGYSKKGGGKFSRTALLMAILIYISRSNNASATFKSKLNP